MTPTAEPTGEAIKVRRMDMEFPDSMPTFWCDGNPLLTATLAALSVSFPPGERFFVSSVRHFLPRIDDASLREQVKAFIGQEANHTKEHIAFNRFLDGKGWPATELEQWVTKRIARMQSASTPERNLARTTALEHFTAILAAAVLEHPEVLDAMSPEAARLWAWHAIEELEHRAVAFDVYKHAVDDEALRIRTMRLVTWFFLVINAYRTTILLRSAGRLFDVRSAVKGWNVLWGSPGIFRKAIPRYLEYYRKDFHPSQLDVGARVAGEEAISGGGGVGGQNSSIERTTAQGSHESWAMNRLRRCEYVPSMPEPDARHLRGLPPAWQNAIEESALDGLKRRAGTLARQLERGGRKEEADELRRRAALLARTDELHQHASYLETIGGLYRVLSTLAGEHEVVSDYDRTLAQAGLLEEPMATAHGPAFRETAALRNRAYHSLAATVARYARNPGRSPWTPPR